MTRLVLQEPAVSLLQEWRAARTSSALPGARFADPLRLRRWIGDISIVHLHDGEKRFFVSLHGVNISLNFDLDFHKKYLEDSVPEASRSDTIAPYELSIQTRQPSYSIQRATIENGLFQSLERMVLPLSLDDPEKVGRFLVWAAPVKPDLTAETSARPSFDDGEIIAMESRGPSDLFLLSERGRQGDRAA